MSNTDLIARLREQWAALDPVDEWRADIAEAIETIEALRADAERYRWLRDVSGCVNIIHSDGKFALPDFQEVNFLWKRRTWVDGKPLIICDGLDAAIDAAIASGKAVTP